MVVKIKNIYKSTSTLKKEKEIKVLPSVFMVMFSRMLLTGGVRVSSRIRSSYPRGHGPLERLIPHISLDDVVIETCPYHSTEYN